MCGRKGEVISKDKWTQGGGSKGKGRGGETFVFKAIIQIHAIL